MSNTLNINNCFKAEARDKVAVLHSDNNGFIFLGTSETASVEPGYDGKSPISFVHEEKNSTGLIAVIDRTHNQGFFLEITLLDSVPYIHAKQSDKPWIPTSGKLLQIIDDAGALSIKMDNQWYTTDQSKKNQCILPISAGNLLCRYAVSEGEESEKLAEEIKQMAINREEEISTKARVPKLENEIAALKTENKKLAAEKEVFKAKTVCLESDFDVLADILKSGNFWNQKKTIRKAKEAIAEFKALSANADKNE